MVFTVRHDLAKRLKQIREQKGFTREEVAFRANMMPMQLEFIEKGTVTFSVDVLELIANALYVDLRIMFEMHEEA